MVILSVPKRWQNVIIDISSQSPLTLWSTDMLNCNRIAHEQNSWVHRPVSSLLFSSSKPSSLIPLPHLAKSGHLCWLMIWRKDNNQLTGVGKMWRFKKCCLSTRNYHSIFLLRFYTGSFPASENSAKINHISCGCSAWKLESNFTAVEN